MAEQGTAAPMEVTQDTTSSRRAFAAKEFARIGLLPYVPTLGDWLFVGEPRSTLSKQRLRSLEKLLGQPNGSAHREKVSRRGDDRRFRMVLKIGALTNELLDAISAYTISRGKDHKSELIEPRGPPFAKPLPCCFTGPCTTDGADLQAAFAAAGFVLQTIYKADVFLRVQFYEQRQLDYFIEQFGKPSLQHVRALLGEINPISFSRVRLTRYFVKPAIAEMQLHISAQSHGLFAFDFVSSSSRSAAHSFAFFSLAKEEGRCDEGDILHLDALNLPSIAALRPRYELATDVRTSASATSDIRQRLERIENQLQKLDERVDTRVEQAMEKNLSKITKELIKEIDQSMESKISKLAEKLLSPPRKRTLK